MFYKFLLFRPSLKTTILGMLFLILLIRAAVHMSLPMLWRYDGMGDAHARVMEASTSEAPPKYGIWMPLHYTVIKYSLQLYNDIYLSPRLATLVIVTFLIVALYALSYSIFHDETTSIIAIALFIFSPFLNTYTTVPITEPLFSCLFIAGLYCIFKNKPHALMSLIFFNLANAVRYEGWYIFCALLPYLIGNWGYKKTLLYSLGYYLYPLYWMQQNHAYTGDYLYFFHDKIAEAHKSPGYKWFDFMTPFLIWGGKLLNHLGIFDVFFGVLGILEKPANIKILTLFLAALLLTGALVVQVFVGTMEWYPDQYLYLPILLLLPLVARGIKIFLRFIEGSFKKRYFSIALVSLTLLVLTNTITDDYAIHRSTIPEISKIIRQYPDRKIIFTYTNDAYPYDMDYIMYFAKHKRYSIEKETYNFPAPQVINEPKTLFVSPINRLSTIYRTCPVCVIIFTDNRYIVWSKLL